MADLFRKVDVIGIPSSDLERSREFYVDTLGLQPNENERYADPDGNQLTLHRRPARYADGEMP